MIQEEPKQSNLKNFQWR